MLPSKGMMVLFFRHHQVRIRHSPPGGAQTRSVAPQTRPPADPALGDQNPALMRLADTREATANQEGADELARLAADAGDTQAMARVAVMREMAGDTRQADHFAQIAADAGNPSALATWLN
jgi:TPR repeat protein